jgi:hypothetical protein
MDRLLRGTTLLVAGLASVAVLGTAAVATAACTVTTGDFDGNGSQDLRVVTDAANQGLEITDDPRGPITTVRLDCDGDTVYERVENFPREFELFDLRLGGGNDTVVVQVPEAANYTKKFRNFAVQLGGGTNSFFFNHFSSAIHPPPTAIFSSLTIDVQGGGGSDDVRFQFRGAEDSRIVLRADLGGGNDRVTLSTWDIVRYHRSSADVEFQLDAGDDTVVYSAPADLWDGSDYRVKIVTGAGTGTVEGGILAFVADGRLTVDVDLGTGDDVLTWLPPMNVGTGSTRGSVQVGVAGGPGHDAVTFSLAGHGAVSSGLSGLVELFVHGDDGNDALVVEMSPEIGDSNVDGTVRVHVDGGAGNDTALATLRTSATSTAAVDFLLRGGLGNDELRLGISGPVSYTPVAEALLDGGPGSDGCAAAGAAVARMQNCELF